MSLADQKTKLAIRSAKARNEQDGIPVRFRQAEIRACVSPVAVSFALESGGLRQGGEFTVRFQSSDLTTPPRRGEPVAFHGRSYLIQQVGEAINNPSEITCTVTPGSAH